MGGTVGRTSTYAGNGIAGNAGISGYAAGSDVGGAVSAANAILDEGLNQAIPYSEGFTQSAIDTMKDFYLQSRRDAREGYETSKGLLAPYAKASYDALDMYLDSLGQTRPESSYDVAQALEGAARKRSLEDTMKQAAWQYQAEPGELTGLGSGGGIYGLGQLDANTIAERMRELPDYEDNKQYYENQIKYAQNNEAQRGMPAGQYLSQFIPGQSQDPYYEIDWLRKMMGDKLISASTGYGVSSGAMTDKEIDFAKQWLGNTQPLFGQYQTLLSEQHSPERQALALGWQTGNWGPVKEI